MASERRPQSPRQMTRRDLVMLCEQQDDDIARLTRENGQLLREAADALDAAPPPERVREPAMRDPKALHAAIVNALLVFGPIDSDDQDDGMVADAVTAYVYGLDADTDLVLVETAPMPSRERLCGRCDGRGVVTTSGLGTPLIPCPDCRAALSPDSGADQDPTLRMMASEYAISDGARAIRADSGADPEPSPVAQDGEPGA